MARVTEDEAEESRNRTEVTVLLEPRLLDALDRFIELKMPDASRATALAAAFEQWASEHGCLPRGRRVTMPEDLNASNDG